MITLENFHSCFDEPAINQVMAAACQEATASPKALYTLMRRFVSYANPYSFLVPQLASVIGSSSLFTDPNCSIATHAERGMDVAAPVFSASIEEFRDPRTAVSHRTLSYALLDKLAEYASLTPAEVDQIDQADAWLPEVLDSVREGYAARPDSLSSMVRAIGFHVGAETIGTNECSVINDVLFSKQKNSAFGQFLRSSKVQFPQGVVSPWYWIAIHGTFETKGVEAEHSAEALLALDRVVQYADTTEEQVVEWARQGFAHLMQVQTLFFQRTQQELRENSRTLVAR